MSELKAVLFSHCKKKEEKDTLKEQYASNAWILQQTLARVLNSRIEESQRRADKIENYDKPDWKALQADQTGYRRAMREVLELLPKIS